MKYKTIFKKGEKCLIKIVLDNEGEKWAETTEAVMNYAKNNFKEGEECGFEYTEKDGKYNVSRILKDGKSTKAEPESTKAKKEEEKVSEYKCEDCGKELKDGKYKKCYTCNQKNKSISSKPKCSDCGKELKDAKYKKCYDCNQKNPSKPAGKSGGNGDLIVRQAVMKAVGSAMSAFAGQVADVETAGKIMCELFDKVYKKVTE